MYVREGAKRDCWFCYVRLTALLRGRLGSHWTDFYDILGIFRKSVANMQVLLKSDMNKW